MKGITRITQSISKVSRHTILKVQFLSTNSILDPPKIRQIEKNHDLDSNSKVEFLDKKFTNVKGTSKNHKFFSPRKFFFNIFPEEIKTRKVSVHFIFS